MIDFTPAARAFFFRVARPDVFGEEGSFLTIRTMPAVIVVFEGEGEFALSLIEVLGRSRILRPLYFSGLRNQRVNICRSGSYCPVTPLSKRLLFGQHFRKQLSTLASPSMSRRKALVNISWRHPPAHSWYRCEDPCVAIRFKGVRKDQTALARLSSGHLKALRFSRGDKRFNICTKCNMIEATPQHLLDCVALVYDDLLKRPDFVLEAMRANDLMDLI
ncbi:hypothetical protein AVEN_233344-1 [Araneus ventricosus]|uniref:Uncharacterized protein n=1 Tax=Araneus ventricosus TaxID=182803 RepID=A0A4Y2FVB0_ARAVE|nr:hypothetical protein AVEN_232647-1 [Araneus ventricosus]GBM45452.1 hypothetical protein AVEN_233344-1 [Araneus ventricosus]